MAKSDKTITWEDAVFFTCTVGEGDDAREVAVAFNELSANEAKSLIKDKNKAIANAVGLSAAGAAGAWLNGSALYSALTHEDGADNNKSDHPGGSAVWQGPLTGTCLIAATFFAVKALNIQMRYAQAKSLFRDDLNRMADKLRPPENEM